MGENTQRVFSYVLARAVTQQGMFGLPNQVYRSPGRDHLRWAGNFLPTVAVPVLADADVATGKDLGLERAVQVLRATWPTTPQ